MKILFWSDGFWPRIGGTETQGFEFVQAMRQRGHDCLVLCQKDDPNWKDEEIYQGIQIRRFDFDAIIQKRDLQEIRSIREFLGWAAEGFGADLIYLNTLGNGSAFAFLLFHKLLSIPTIATVHAPHFLDGKMPALMVQVCNAVDRICCASQWGLNIMEKQLPLLRNKLQLIYCGISLPKIPPAPLPFSPPAILLLGRLSSEKAFEIGIEAFSLLKNEGSTAQLLIAGEGDERPYLEQLVHRLNLMPFTQFTGSLSRDEVYSIINKATFTVVPSNLEGFGLVALESMRMGRPVIASDVGGLPEIVSSGERGFLVPPRDSYAFYKAMKNLLEEPSLCEKMGQNARNWSRERFLLEENVDQYERLFQDYCPHCRL